MLEGLVLEIIKHQETYGYEITKMLNELGFTDIVEGTVYTVLLRIEKNELVTIEKKPSEKGHSRKFYSLNEKGLKELEDFWQRWDFISDKMTEVKKYMEEK